MTMEGIQTISGWTIPACLAQAFGVMAVAPLVDGLMRKLVARVQSRQGPPILQSYYDLFKLFGKEDLEVAEVPWVQRVVAWTALGTVLFMACVLPLGAPAPLGRATDALLLVHLITLAALTNLFAGLAAGSTYSIIGISREAMMMVALEPLLAVAVLAGAIHTKSLAVAQAVHGAVYVSSGIPWSGLLLLGVISLAFPAFLQRVPFDLAEAETEIMEGWLLEYSGPKLGLFKLSQMTKTVLYAGLFTNLFLPWGDELPFGVGWLIFWVKTLAVVILFTLVAASHARYRVDHAIRWFAAFVGIGMVGLWLAALGW